jgi:hypothetical protein
MLNIQIKNLPYLPLNRAKMLARNKLIKTQFCREFEKDLEERLKEYSKEMALFRSKVDATTCYLKITYVLSCPPDEYFTKEGKISSRCPDVDSIKILQDTLFKAIGVDDKYIKDLSVLMIPSTDEFWNYSIKISSHPISVLGDLL